MESIKRNVYDHLRLLSRSDRTNGLLNAIQSLVKKDDSVLDAGCGSGVLSLLAVKNGASKVIGVDLGSVEMAEELSEENGFSERISFIQTRLENLNLEGYQNKFDAIIGMIYYNDPRRDENQQKIIFDLKKRYLKPNGRMLPDCVKYYAYGCDWPFFDINKKRICIEEQIKSLEGQYQLSLNKTFTKYAENQIDRYFFPIRDHIREGKILNSENNSLLLLGDPTVFCKIKYNNDSFEYPEEFPIKISYPGRMTSIIWVQELWFQDILIFSTESISYIKNPKIVKPMDAVMIHLGDKWRKTNRAEIVWIK